MEEVRGSNPLAPTRVFQNLETYLYNFTLITHLFSKISYENVKFDYEKRNIQI